MKQHCLYIIIFILSLNSCSDNITNYPDYPKIGHDSIFISKNKAVFLAGVNFPWLNYGHDFGQANFLNASWSYDGIASFNSYRNVDSLFTLLKTNNIEYLRIFLFCDGRANPEFDSNNIVIGFDNYFYKDFNALLDLANKHSIKLIVSILDYIFLYEEKYSNGIKLYGRRDVILDIVKRKSFFDKCLQPFLEVYGSNNNIIGFELMNEPEWVINELASSTPLNSVSLISMKEFFIECISLIRAKSSKLITLGCADCKYLSAWKDLDLDFFQVHSYKRTREEAPFIPKSNLNLTKSVIIGEFPTKLTQFSLFDYLDASWNYGYAGAFAWSLNAKDDYSNFSISDYGIWLKKIQQR